MRRPSASRKNAAAGSPCRKSVRSARQLHAVARWPAILRQLLVVELREQLRRAQVDAASDCRDRSSAGSIAGGPSAAGGRSAGRAAARAAPARERGGSHDDGRRAAHGALVLADAAADAAARGPPWGASPSRGRPGALITYRPLSEHDRLVRRGAHLLADDARACPAPTAGSGRGRSRRCRAPASASRSSVQLGDGARTGRRGRRRCTSSRSSPRRGRARASRAPPGRPRPAPAAGPDVGQTFMHSLQRRQRERKAPSSWDARRAEEGRALAARATRRCRGAATAPTPAPAAARNCRRPGS